MPGQTDRFMSTPLDLLERESDGKMKLRTPINLGAGISGSGRQIFVPDRLFAERRHEGEMRLAFGVRNARQEWRGIPVRALLMQLAA